MAYEDKDDQGEGHKDKAKEKEEEKVKGKRKTLHPLKHVFTVALGTRQMYDFMDDNPSMESYPVSYVNDPAVIARNDRLISVNSVLEVDLLGQCNSEYLGGFEFSGTGGQLDFVRGAFNSSGGKSVIAFYSTAHQEEISRVVPRLAPGTVVPPTDFGTITSGAAQVKA